MNQKLTDRLKAWGFQAGQSLRVSTSEHLDSPERVLEWWNGVLEAHPQCFGWAQFSGANILVDKGKLLGESRGILLAGELSDGTTSFHLRKIETRWLGAVIVREADPAAFLEIREFIGYRPAKSLAYEVAWTGAPLRPTLSRLTEAALQP